MTPSRILIVEDEASLRMTLREVMRKEGYEVEEAANGREAVEIVSAGDFDLVLMDIKMPEMNGIDALKEMRRVRPFLMVVMITAFGSREVALDAMRLGAYDFFTKPFELDEIRVVVRRALEKMRLQREVSDLRSRLQARASFDRIIGSSQPMQELFALLERVVENDVTVLITGESGTGKELVAQAIHYNSARVKGPFISINCAAIPENLLESELFGHERGSFTGAVGQKIGRFEAATGGTIFLDEIGEMPLGLQSKLLRALQEREFMRVGGTRPIKVNIRVVAASNRDLAECVRERSFREDLYFRLAVMTVHLPPLRLRHGDVGLLAESMIARYNPRLNKQIVGFAPAVMEILQRYPWPGNVRELENVVQRAMVLCTGALIDVPDLPPHLAAYVPDQRAAAVSSHLPGMIVPVGAVPTDGIDLSVPLQEQVDRMAEALERRIIRAALDRTGGRRQETADVLGISRKSLHNKMVKYGMFDVREDEGAADASQ